MVKLQAYPVNGDCKAVHAGRALSCSRGMEIAPTETIKRDLSNNCYLDTRLTV